jgi:hypothetical protein
MLILTNGNVVLLTPAPSDGPLLLPESETSIPFSGIARQLWAALPLTSPNPSVPQPSVEPSRAP